MAAPKLNTVWRNFRPLLAPLALCLLVILILREPLSWWLHGEEKYDQESIKEWIREAGTTKRLKELVKGYLDQAQRLRELPADKVSQIGEARQLMALKRDQIQVHLHSLGNLLNQLSSQLPLFPIIYQVNLEFDPSLALPKIIWDSQRPRQKSQYQLLNRELLDDQGTHVSIQYHLHAYTQQQYKEKQEATRRLWISGLGIFFALLALSWFYMTQRRERERQKMQIEAEQQILHAERLHLEEALRRQEAEHKQQEAERQALELKSQLFANIGIMAGSYAHNIKNLLVRPNDLLRRCLEEKPALKDQAAMLSEVRQTLGTVTERLQQILHTVRRDPSQSEKTRIDLQTLVREMHRTWADLAKEKWKLNIHLDFGGRDSLPPTSPLWIEGDLSHLQQALENLLFNARDATFEMRNHLREQARKQGESPNREPSGDSPPLDAERRQALIAAAGWKGQVTLRTRRQGDFVLLEVQDNGIGMTEEVRRRCIETHFSTKRNNALFAGLSAGMGLGLSFVTVILEHHGARLEIESTPLHGATFRVIFPMMK